jgi:hypothetical protein
LSGDMDKLRGGVDQRAVQVEKHRPWTPECHGFRARIR